MKKVRTRSIKILIESNSISASDLVEIEQWENEGGTSPAQENFLQSLAPLKKGQIFEVKGGDFHYSDNELYFEADIEILALP
jgi:hypothetical protein